MSVFNRCGLASVDDLNSDEMIRLLAQLEGWQLRLLEHDEQFRSQDYPWPRAPLYSWSRIWEYPYALAHLEEYRSTYSETVQPSAVDIGSGVTFFPFVMADSGFTVTAVDNDPRGQTDYPRAVQALNLPKDTVVFRLADAAALPFDDHSVDIVCCISVLEHVQDPISVITEVNRILKSNGLFILTIDLTMDILAQHALNPSQYRVLRNEIDKHFIAAVPEMTVHPAVMLTEANSPYSPKIGLSLRMIASSIKRYFYKMVGYKTIQNPHRTVFGYVGMKREWESKTLKV